MNTPLPHSLTDHVTVFGNDHFRHFLVGKNQDLLIECGVTASARLFARKLADSHLSAPEKLLVMHAHFDHVCGIPELKRHFPEAEVLASSVAAKTLENPKVMAGFFDQDRLITGEDDPDIFKQEKGKPSPPDRIAVDHIVEGGESLVLKGGDTLELIHAPGHSPCGLAAWYEKDRILFVSDALGFQISEDTIFPTFFQAYKPYIDTIERLAKYPARILAFPHERIWQGKEIPAIFSRALSAAKEVRDEVIWEADRGRDLLDLEEMLFEKSFKGDLRIYSEENIRLCAKLLVRRSIESR